MTNAGHAVVTEGHFERCDGEAFRAELEQERRFRIEQLESLAGDRSAGTDGALNEVTSALTTAARAALRDVEAALARIRLGTFGLCGRCGEVIAPERIRALPMASLCMACQYQNETNQH